MVNYTPVAEIIGLIAADPNIVRVANEYLSEEGRKTREGRLAFDEGY